MKYIAADKLFEYFKQAGWSIEQMEQHGFIERQVPYKQDFASLPLSKMTPEQVYKAGAESVIDGVTLNKAKAWDETCCLLNKLRPGWMDSGRTGMEAMRKTLQSMHVQARMPTKEQLLKALEEAIEQLDRPPSTLIPNRASTRAIGERAYENLMLGSFVTISGIHDITARIFKKGEMQDGP